MVDDIDTRSVKSDTTVIENLTSEYQNQEEYLADCLEEGNYILNKEGFEKGVIIIIHIGFYPLPALKYMIRRLYYFFQTCKRSKLDCNNDKVFRFKCVLVFCFCCDGGRLPFIVFGCRSWPLSCLFLEVLL